MAHSFNILRMATIPIAGKTAMRQRIAPTARCEKTPFAIGLRQRRNAKKPPSPSVCANGAMQKTAEERFHTLARGWPAYPVTSIHSHLPPKSGCRNPIPRFANNLYNRSSAVDSSFYNQPQVGKPTWGYNYPTVLRRLPSVIIIGLRHRRDAKNRRRAV